MVQTVEEKKIAQREYHRKWRKNHPEACQKAQRKYRQTHIKQVRESRRKYNENHKTEARKWREEHPEACRAATIKWKNAHSEQLSASHRKRQYGINQEEYVQRLADQNGVCAICGKEEKSLCVDHNHSLGVIRGLLCKHCNAALGLLQDDPGLLRKAADYLEQNSQ